VRGRLGKLVGTLRDQGVTVSVAEAVDAARAAAVVGVERRALRDALAAALVKDEVDRPVFEQAFDEVFPPRPAEPARGRARRGLRPSGDQGVGAATARGAESGSARAGSRGAAAPVAAVRPRPLVPAGGSARASGGPLGAGEPPGERASTRGESEREAASRESDAAREGARARSRRLRARALRRMAIRAMSVHDVEEAAALVAALARRFERRLRRRRAPRPRGRLDFRRTLRAAVARGGVPFVRRYRGRRPAKTGLVALCDLSASAATATEFFLALLAPAARYFAPVRLFGFVDRLVEIEFVDGQVRPAGPIDLMARSDFGQVLRDLTVQSSPVLTADTLLLVLGDARNNRRPPRADLLAAARARVRRLLWLNPEPEERWNTGDSVIAGYARHADAVIACGSLAELDRALVRLARW
jgi:uncharacterized protein